MFINDPVLASVARTGGGRLHSHKLYNFINMRKQEWEN